MQQRVRALEAFLADVYDAGQVFADGVIPRRVIVTSSHFHRQAAGVRPPNGVRVHVSGIDLVRDDARRVPGARGQRPGAVRGVLRDDQPAGDLPRPCPSPSRSTAIRPVAGYPQRLLAALRAAAPAGVADPTVVVLTPGVHNGAYFEHALLARTMGVELVEGRDLAVPARPGDDADHQRPRAGARDLPAGRRRVPRPCALPRRLDARLPWPDRRGPGRQRDPRQRDRQRRRRRQARLHLRARPDPLLPRRGAGPAQRRHLAARRRGGPRGGARPPRRARAQAGRRLAAARAS